jgi:2-oxoglutarate ferredoxin oxidoreductase subunit beta
MVEILKIMGHPLHITELVAMLPGTYYVTRQSVHKPATLEKLKKQLEKLLKINSKIKDYPL